MRVRWDWLRLSRKIAVRARLVNSAAASLPLVVLILALSAGFASPLLAQEDEQRRVVAVNVIDNDGRQVSGLTAASFRGEFRGQPVRILSADRDTSPRRVALVVDTSASMERALDFAWSAAEDLVLRLTPAHKVSIFTLGEKLQRHSDLSSDPRELQEALLDARVPGPRGPSALYNGVVVASRALGGTGFGDVLYLISDGEDTSSLTTASDALTAAAQAAVRVFVVRPVPSPADRHRLAFSFADTWTASLAGTTGGLVVRLQDYRRDGIAKLGSLIAQVYRLEVVFQRGLDKRREWKLEVVDGNGRKLKDIRVLYPRLVIPPPRK